MVKTYDWENFQSSDSPSVHLICKSQARMHLQFGAPGLPTWHQILCIDAKFTLRELGRTRHLGGLDWWDSVAGYVLMDQCLHSMIDLVHLEICSSPLFVTREQRGLRICKEDRKFQCDSKDNSIKTTIVQLPRRVTKHDPQIQNYDCFPTLPSFWLYYIFSEN